MLLYIYQNYVVNALHKQSNSFVISQDGTPMTKLLVGLKEIVQSDCKASLKGDVQPKLIRLYFSYASQECSFFCTPMTSFQLTAGFSPLSADVTDLVQVGKDCDHMVRSLDRHLAQPLSDQRRA